MRIRAVVIVALAAPLLAGGCQIKQESEAPEADASSAAPAAAASAAPATAAAFDPAGVPESSGALPPFPLFKPLDGLTNNLNDKRANVAFDRDWFITGETMQPVEGKVFRGEYRLTGDRPYTSLEFLRNHEAAITALGGRKVGGTLSTNPYRLKLQGTSPAPTSHCFIDPCDETDFYLIRQGGKEWWISVGTGSFPLHGYVVVLEKQGMAKSYAFMDAAQLKSMLDARGRVPVYIEFDVDRATIRPEARPAVDEIIRLMQANPALALSIEGHTDDTGVPARNQPLSLARAEAVRAELIAAGIAPARMKTAGFGASQPLVPGSDADARARNRRVELVKL